MAAQWHPRRATPRFRQQQVPFEPRLDYPPLPSSNGVPPVSYKKQKRGFVCPQCRGPRRRFAKKVGNQVGITQDGGDAPILLFSFLGLGATVAFGYWFAGQ